ncbi:hypothetical protein ACH5RR_002753 [Cinchona calisaya]|uniref:KIB1-4 beta-propeller domain-containing protein n=1 Tax=Cinchona calisaya TaxID=153742 RepID=A0ABD3ASU8_9GENT
MNEDTGRIMYTNHCDWFYDEELDEEDWWEDDPGRYHFLNIAKKKLVKLEKNMRTMWRGAPFPSMISSRCLDDTVVMIIHGYKNESQLAFCRLGDETWTALNGLQTFYQDIMYFSKDQKFYALSKSDQIEAWDLRSSSSSSSFTLVNSEYPSFAHSDDHQGD